MCSLEMVSSAWYLQESQTSARWLGPSKIWLSTEQGSQMGAISSFMTSLESHTVLTSVAFYSLEVITTHVQEQRNWTSFVGGGSVKECVEMFLDHHTHMVKPVTF